MRTSLAPAVAFRHYRPVRLRAGTSGFSYKEWKGPFYPEQLPAKDMLGYYAERARARADDGLGLPPPPA